ncbi:MAG: hypothetical protein IK093_07360 [Ruminiclostridium sp.]|nr:hypothetical protein [Ruminiclostridium sp.]
MGKIVGIVYPVEEKKPVEETAETSAAEPVIEPATDVAETSAAESETKPEKKNKPKKA